MLETQPRCDHKLAQAPASPRVWHLITCEYPPKLGGVSDYSYLVAQALGRRGDRVHVWCPATGAGAPPAHGVEVHAQFGKFSVSDLNAVGRALDSFPQPRRLFVQWVPHGFGYKSLNLPFCLWLWWRALFHRDEIQLMVHEPCSPFGRNLRQNAAAAMHRLMIAVLMRGTRLVWMSIPEWEARFRPFTLGRRIDFRWLAVPSNVPLLDDPAAVERIRHKYAPAGQVLIGHFGTHGWPVTDMLRQILLQLAVDPDRQRILLIGVGSREFQSSLVAKAPALAPLIRATGPLPPDQLSAHLSACDLFLQPYPDGVSSRRTSVMAGLARGKPIVSTFGALTAEVWRESRAIALAPVDDTKAFVDSAWHLANDPVARAELGAKAQAFYEQNFALEHIVDTLRLS